MSVIIANGTAAELNEVLCL